MTNPSALYIIGPDRADPTPPKGAKNRRQRGDLHLLSHPLVINQEVSAERRCYAFRSMSRDLESLRKQSCRCCSLLMLPAAIVAVSVRPAWRGEWVARRETKGRERCCDKKPEVENHAAPSTLEWAKVHHATRCRDGCCARHAKRDTTRVSPWNAKRQREMRGLRPAPAPAPDPAPPQAPHCIIRTMMKSGAPRSHVVAEAHPRVICDLGQIAGGSVPFKKPKPGQTQPCESSARSSSHTPPPSRTLRNAGLRRSSRMPLNTIPRSACVRAICCCRCCSALPKNPASPIQSRNPSTRSRSGPAESRAGPDHVAKSSDSQTSGVEPLDRSKGRKSGPRPLPLW